MYFYLLYLFINNQNRWTQSLCILKSGLGNKNDTHVKNVSNSLNIFVLNAYRARHIYIMYWLYSIVPVNHDGFTSSDRI